MKQKCVGKGCKEQGEASAGFDFFVCENCLAELAFWLEFYGRQKAARHEDNN